MTVTTERGTDYGLDDGTRHKENNLLTGQRKKKEDDLCDFD